MGRTFRWNVFQTLVVFLLAMIWLDKPLSGGWLEVITKR
jgi:hypothetical protein